MPKYVDGCVIPVTKKNLPIYRKMAPQAAKIWLDHGALEVKECAGDDFGVKWGLPFPGSSKLKKGATAVFSWIRDKSRKGRNRVNARVMEDPRLKKPDVRPFDDKRMVSRGFTVPVDV
jgi:uncharacterized protein YbaA (DUF1428 family)